MQTFPHFKIERPHMEGAGAGKSSFQLQADDVLRILADLAENLKDACTGYRMAAEVVVDESFAQRFEANSQRRESFVGDLISASRAYEPEVAPESPAVDRLHRGWQDITGAIESADITAIITACVQGEDRALESYDDALALPLPKLIVPVLETHRDEIHTTRSWLLSLHDNDVRSL